MKSCFFIGHHDAPNSVQGRLNQEVERLVTMCDVTQFVVGYHGNFDHMATIAVQKVKARQSELYAYRLIPYHPAEVSVPIPELFDDTYYPFGLETVPRRYAIPRANRLALKKSDYLIAYVNWDGGNSAALLRRARTLEKKGDLKVINLAEKDD